MLDDLMDLDPYVDEDDFDPDEDDLTLDLEWTDGDSDWRDDREAEYARQAEVEVANRADAWSLAW